MTADSSKYRVCIVGCGPRGAFHAEGFLANQDRFEVTACCDLNAERLGAFAERFGIATTYADVKEMLDAERPDVFCFATLPEVRLSLVDLALQYPVKAIAMEKPVAEDLVEARELVDRCSDAGVKLVVSHQQKYGPHWQKVKEIVDSGALGTVDTIRGTARSWLSQLGTHLIDYMLWYNGGARVSWVAAHVHGTDMLADSHPSPDYTLGELGFSNGVRGIVECGALAPRHMGDNPLRSQGFWCDNTVSVYGSHGYARVCTGGGWQAFTRDTKGEVISGDGSFDPSYEQPLYIRDLADWLDGKIATHPCDGDISYHGFEVSMALYISALERRPVNLPLETLPEGSLVERLRRELPSYHGYAGQ